MERSKVKTFVPKSGNVSDSNEQIVDIDSKKSKKSDSRWLTYSKGIGLGFLGLVIGIVFFIAAYWFIPQHLHVGYVMLSILSLLVAAGVLKAFDYGLGEKQTVLSGPITIALFVIFILSLYYGSEHSATENIDQIEQVDGAETLIITDTKAYPMSRKCYHNGEQVRIVVLDNPVKTVLGDELSVGEHVIQMTSDGRLGFHIETNQPARVMIY